MKNVILAATAAVALFGTPASAATKHSVEVRLSPADLSVRGGQSAYKKLVKAARAECITSGRKSLNDTFSENRCYRELMVELVEKVGNNDVAALHATAQKQ